MSFDRQMEAAAVALASLLNVVDDDDERERLEHVFERKLNDELYAARPADVVVHPTLARRIVHGTRVQLKDGRSGRVCGFRRHRSWAFRRPQTVTWARVRIDGSRDLVFVPPADLRVIEPPLAEGGVQ